MAMVLATQGTKIPHIEIHLGMRLAAARDEVGLTQERMAEMIGVDRRTIVRWETNKTPAPILATIAYSVASDVNLGWIQTGIEGIPSEDYARDVIEYSALEAEMENEKALTIDGKSRSYTPRDSNPEPAD